MKKGILFGAILVFALAFSLSADVNVLAGPDFLSPFGPSKPPTIPILPPIG
ncbi:hypothetical protein AB5N96_06170 [Chryseomicrobium imtechense]